LLQDEVIFLNHLEAEYRVGKSWKEPVMNSVQKTQTLQMI
jgi:hypothetical protein